MSDRTVHARYPRWEIVRYGRAGKWYLESTDGEVQRPLPIAAAVNIALMGVTNGGEILYGRSGGRLFDAKARALAMTVPRSKAEALATALERIANPDGIVTVDDLCERAAHALIEYRTFHPKERS